MYASSGSTGYAEYSFDFSDIPSGATIEEISARIYGHRESSTIDSTHVSSCQLYSNGVAISEEVDFPYTSDSEIAVEASTVPSSVSGVTLRHFVGYYGGLVLGITLTVIYSTGSGLDHYTYTFTVSGDTTIAVVIGGSSQTLYFKNGSSWTAVSAVYVKTNGAWVKQSDLTNIFDSTKRYRNGS